MTRLTLDQLRASQLSSLSRYDLTRLYGVAKNDLDRAQVSMDEAQREFDKATKLRGDVSLELAGRPVPKWGVVRKDNYDRESVAEHWEVQPTIECRAVAEELCETLRISSDRMKDYWYVVQPDDYPLWRGMEELV